MPTPDLQIPDLQVPDFQIQSTYTRIIARVLKLPERQLPELLAGTGIAADVFNPGDNSLVTAEDQAQVMKNARRLSPSPDLGLRIGSMLDPSSHGALGYLVLSSPDLHTALHGLSAYLPIRLPWTAVDIRRCDGWLEARLRLHLDLEDEPDIVQMFNECFAMTLQSMCEQVLGREIGEAEIALSHAAPDDISIYSDFLHATCSFEATQSCYRLPLSMEFNANVVGDPAAYTVAKQLCDQLLLNSQTHHGTTAAKVRMLLLMKPFATTTEKDVSDSLFVSRRTLGRRLESEGTSYREVRDSVLSELSIKCLGETAQSVESIATTLGYSDSAAFRKAFRRWTGQTPSDFRRRRGTAPIAVGNPHAAL